MKRKILLLLLSTSLIVGICFFKPAATIAAYPEQNVIFICPFRAGESIDLIARTITEAARKYFLKPMVVVNRPGGAGTVGTAEIILAKPDGYTIGISAVGMLTVQPHRTKLPYASVEDYSPIIMLANLPILLAVKSTSPWQTIHEFVYYAQANPGKLRVGVPGIGTLLHFNVEQLKLMSKIDLTVVPFVGSAESVPALLGGHIEAVSANPAAVLPHVEGKKLRVLGVFEDKRNPIFPDVPTFKEVGYDITLGVYYPVIGPKGLPSHILSMLHDALKKAMEDQIFVRAMKTGGFDIFYEGPQDLKKRLIKDFETNRKLVDIFREGK